MTLDEIEQLTLTQFAEFEVPTSTSSGLVGVPWSADRYAAAILEMRTFLIKPSWQLVGVYDYPLRKTLLGTRDFAVVARDGDYTLLFDPQQSAFVLGFDFDGHITTDAYPSDAVSTFASR